MKNGWNFWDWLNKPKDVEERFWFAKRIIASFIVFFIIPALIYSVVKRDPVIVFDEMEYHVGMWVIIGLYWVGVYFACKRDKARRRLNCLLDKLLNQDGNELHSMIKEAKRRSELISLGYSGLTREDRVKWFGIP